MQTLDLFKKVSDYFVQKTREDGSLICPKHGVEHTGKNVYSVIIDLELYKTTQDEKYFQRAKSRVQRTCLQLGQDPEYGYWIFFPGRLGRWNMANSIIDAGACVDALSCFYLNYSNKLSLKEKQDIEQAILKVGDSYLTKHIVVKPITNQRLWGATGLAKAYQIFKKPEWREALINSVEKSFEEMLPDGVFPYNPNWRGSNASQGINDTTPYYHSRCIAFIYYILESIGEPLDKYQDKLVKATDLLVAMYQPDGIKNINLEAKRWYWNSSYEIASNTFDIYALGKSYNLTKNTTYLYYSQKALNQIFKHLLKDGGITSHLKEPQHSFQCRIFWNAHLAWMLRGMRGVSALPAGSGEELRHFQDSGIIKFKNQNYSCILRVNKEPISLMWGPAIAGGSLLYFGTKENNWRDTLLARKWEDQAPFNFTIYVKENYFKNLKKTIRDNKREIKNKVYHSLVELKCLRIRSFVFLSLRVLKMIISASKGVYTSQWATKAEIVKQDNSIVFNVIPTKRDGKKLVDVKLKREYTFGEHALSLKETLFVNNKKVKKVRYNQVSNPTERLDTSYKIIYGKN